MNEHIFFFFYIILIRLYIFPAQVIRNNSHFVFNQSINCTESLRKDILRKNMYYYKHDRGITQHICSQVTLLQNNFTYIGFKSYVLLNILRNKKLAITGDSLGLQFFIGLFSSLCHEDHIFSAGNGTTSSDVTDAAFTYYTKYNTTITWCRSPFLKDWQTIQWMSFCGNQVANSDYIVLAYGAWYKPFYASPYNDASLTYAENLEISLREFNTSLYTSRHAILAANPTVSLIYRTHPHVGNIDEMNWEREHCHRNATVCTVKGKSGVARHSSGRYWSNAKLLANWTIAQNIVLRQFVHHTDAILLDWYSLSLASFAYFNTLGVRTHSDSIHYCTEGLPRLASLLLQLALTDIDRQ